MTTERDATGVFVTLRICLFFPFASSESLPLFVLEEIVMDLVLGLIHELERNKHLNPTEHAVFLCITFDTHVPDNSSDTHKPHCHDLLHT